MEVPCWTNVECATVLVPFTSVDARAFQWGNATATAMCSTIAAFAVVTEPAAFAQSTQWVATPRLLAMNFALSKEENSAFNGASYEAEGSWELNADCELAIEDVTLVSDGNGGWITSIVVKWICLAMLFQSGCAFH